MDSISLPHLAGALMFFYIFMIHYLFKIDGYGWQFIVHQSFFILKNFN